MLLLYFAVKRAEVSAEVQEKQVQLLHLFQIAARLLAVRGCEQVRPDAKQGCSNLDWFVAVEQDVRRDFC
jgi:hypothetical protein